MYEYHAISLLLVTMLVAWIWMLITNPYWHLILTFMLFSQLVLFLSYQFWFNKKKDVKGKTVLITGGTSGIGFKMVQEFLDLGANVVVISDNEQQLLSLSNLKTQFSITNRQIECFLCDVSNRENVQTCASMILENRKIDIVINNAGIVIGKTIERLSPEEIERTINVNLMAHFWITKAFLPHMIERKQGHFVFISSIAGIIGMNNLADYCARYFG